MNGDNSPATPTPATDGDRIYAYFGTPGLLCVDRRGRRLWINTRLPFESREGVASSPILVDGRVIVLSESDAGVYLAAVDAKTGRLAWKTDRRKKTHSFAGNCRTPIAKRIDGRDDIVVWGYEDVSGYDAATGRELWTRSVGDLGTGGNPVASMASDDERLYLVGPGEAVALRIVRSGAANASVRPVGGYPAIAWRRRVAEGSQVASPVVVGGLLFAVSDNGSIHCLDARSGREYWRVATERQHYASPIVAGDRVYCIDTSGRTTVTARDRHPRTLAINELNERVFATPVPVAGELYVRTFGHLYRIGR